jgi:hypothetical protein
MGVAISAVHRPARVSRRVGAGRQNINDGVVMVGLAGGVLSISGQNRPGVLERG